MHKNVQSYFIIIVFTILVFICGMAAYFIRFEKTITTESKWWVYTVDVGHTYTTTRVMYVNNKPIITTDTHWSSTCKQSKTGFELPVTRPEVTCTDEKLRTEIKYYIRYHESNGKSKQAEILGNNWYRYIVGDTRTAKQDLFNKFTNTLRLYN